MSGYELRKKWREWSFSRKGVKPIHHAVVQHIYDVANDCRWADEFQLPTREACAQLGISEPDTFRKILKDLNDWGIIAVHQESVNQHEARWISLDNDSICLPKKPVTTTTSKPTSNRVGEPIGTTVTTTTSTPTSRTPKINIETLKHKNIKQNIEREGGNHSIASNSRKFQKPEHLEVSDYFQEYTKSTYDPDRFANQFIDHYESKGWKIGKEGMKDWKAAVRTWVNRDPDKYKTPENPKVLRVLKAYDEATGKHFDIEIPNRKVIV